MATQHYKTWHTCVQCYGTFLGLVQKDICPDCASLNRGYHVPKVKQIHGGTQEWEVIAPEDMAGCVLNMESALLLIATGFISGGRLKERQTGCVFAVDGSALRGTDSQSLERLPYLNNRKARIAHENGAKNIREWGRQLEGGTR